MEGAPQEHEEGLLSPEAAQEEANMLRAKMSESLGHEPTAEDYEQAFQSIEELKKLVEEEPATEKVLSALGRMASEGIGNVVFILRILKTIPADLVDYGGVREEIFDFPADIADKVRRSKAIFGDASHQLQQLKEKAEKQ